MIIISYDLFIITVVNDINQTEFIVATGPSGLGLPVTAKSAVLPRLSRTFPISIVIFDKAKATSLRILGPNQNSATGYIRAQASSAQVEQ